jgi:FkbM family methyltransferase
MATTRRLQISRRMKLVIVALLVAIPVATLVVIDNPLCSTVAAFRGAVKSRMVSARTTQILRDTKLIRIDEDGFHLWSTPKGEFWLPQEADSFWSLAVLLAEQEQEIYGRPGGLGVHTGDIVLDAGAHVGMFARTALAAGAKKVIAFEITPRSLECLRRNLAREIADGRVLVLEKGVWHEEGTLPLVIVEKCSACSHVGTRTSGTTTAINVPLITIDRAVDELKLDRVDFIKLDIENAEANALRGAQRTLAKYRPRVAVAIENARNRLSYASEIDDVMRTAFRGYRFQCGACIRDRTKRNRIVPEILHYYP